jgi:hypothetical protein
LVKAQIPLNGYGRDALILFKFVWRQSELAFFRALTSVGALFYFIFIFGGKENEKTIATHYCLVNPSHVGCL